MRIAILVAMEKELRQLQGLLHDAQTVVYDGYTSYSGTAGPHHITLLQCGMGKVNAAIGANVLIRHTLPELVVSTGVAGGCGSEVEVMDVIVSTACCYHDVYCGPNNAYGQMQGLPERFITPAELVAKAQSLQTPVRVHAGVIATGDWFVDSVEKMHSILSLVPDAQAVDMESAAIAHACYLAKVPFLSFRIISDTPLRDEKAKQYFDFWDHVAADSFEVIKAFIHHI